MYMSRFQILNYKSFLETTEIEFKPGFNVITGKNSAGKTSLLEALTTVAAPLLVPAIGSLWSSAS